MHPALPQPTGPHTQTQRVHSGQGLLVKSRSSQHRPTISTDRISIFCRDGALRDFTGPSGNLTPPKNWGCFLACSVSLFSESLATAPSFTSTLSWYLDKSPMGGHVGSLGSAHHNDNHSPCVQTCLVKGFACEQVLRSCVNLFTFNLMKMLRVPVPRSLSLSVCV